MVRGGGLEPPQALAHQILNLARLPNSAILAACCKLLILLIFTGKINLGIRVSKKKNSTIIYSTDSGWQPTCQICLERLDACRCQENGVKRSIGEVAHLRLERKGRRGKTVTTVSNLKGDLRPLQRELQKLCGTGGTVKNGVVEIQGDFRDKISHYLEQKGYSTKLIGG